MESYEYNVIIPSLKTVIKMQDGDGSQLDSSDYNNGLDSYVDYEVITGKNEGDGGLLCYSSDEVSKWTDKIPETIKYALDITGDCPGYILKDAA